MVLILNSITMKNLFLFCMLLFSIVAFSQSDTLKSTFLSVTPRSQNVEQVNGIAIGAGVNMSQNNTIEKINGLNIEINPLSLFVMLLADPTKTSPSIDDKVVVNGLSIGTGHSIMNASVVYSGIQISMFNTGLGCNGISINGVYNYVETMNGFHVSGISNTAVTANGMFLSFANHSDTMNGFQLGVINSSEYFKGLQIGVYNKTNKQKGLQIGFWNSNGKRSMPFINW